MRLQNYETSELWLSVSKFVRVYSYNIDKEIKDVVQRTARSFLFKFLPLPYHPLPYHPLPFFPPLHPHNDKCTDISCRLWKYQTLLSCCYFSLFSFPTFFEIFMLPFIPTLATAVPNFLCRECGRQILLQ